MYSGQESKKYWKRKYLFKTKKKKKNLLITIYLPVCENSLSAVLERW